MEQLTLKNYCATIFLKNEKKPGTLSEVTDS